MEKSRFNAPRVVLISIIVVVMALLIVNNKSKQNYHKSEIHQTTQNFAQTVNLKEAQAANAETILKQNDNTAKKRALPKLVDLGADRCIPCKMMAPILEELKQEYKGKFDVEVIDVWKFPEAGNAYKIRLIPTQIFFDDKGKELYRHEGFMSKQDILKKWSELGYRFEK